MVRDGAITLCKGRREQLDLDRYTALAGSREKGRRQRDRRNRQRIIYMFCPLFIVPAGTEVMSDVNAGPHRYICCVLWLNYKALATVMVRAALLSVHKSIRHAHWRRQQCSIPWSLPGPYVQRGFLATCQQSPFAYLAFFSILRILHVVIAQSSSGCANGFAISSLPSTGLTRTSRVPLATTRPSGRVDSFPSSSV